MRDLVKSSVLVTLLTMAGQAVAFATHVVLAAELGAGASMDAFLAADAVFQYVNAVLLGSLGLVFVPMFVDYLSAGRDNEAWEVASSVLNLFVLCFAALAALGMCIPDSILGMTAPGLPAPTQKLATRVAMITWPGIIPSVMIPLLAGIYQSQSQFGWPAAVVVIGAAAKLALFIALATWWGVVGLAVATTAALTLQVLLLSPVVLREGCYRIVLNWRHPGVLKVLALLAPIALANVAAKVTMLLDRYLASSMPEGSISHLGYAFRLFSTAALFISTGISTVVFPRMAGQLAEAGVEAVKRTLSASLRYMWLAVAPATTLGVVLASPLVTGVFQRGQFGITDAAAVARLLQVYLLALAGGCLAAITGRGFYVLKDTRTLALLGSVEAVAYVMYTIMLTRYVGVVGVAWGFVIYFNVSLVWQAIIIRYKTGKKGGLTVLGSFVRTGLAALVGGAGAWGATALIPGVWPQLLLGGLAGIAVYILGLYSMRVSEAQIVWSALTDRSRLLSRGCP